MAWLGFWGCLALAFVIWKTLKFKKKLCSLSRKNVPWNFNQFLTKSIGVYVKSTAEKFRLFTDTLLKDNCNYFLPWKKNDCANFEPINRKNPWKTKGHKYKQAQIFCCIIHYSRSFQVFFPGENGFLMQWGKFDGNKKERPTENDRDERCSFNCNQRIRRKFSQVFASNGGLQKLLISQIIMDR